MTRTLFLRLASALGVICLCLATFAGALSPAADGQTTTAAQDDDTVTMTLLHNNDGESKLLPNLDSGFPGVARFTQMLQDLGTSSDADILLRVTSGDNFLASKEFSAGLARNGEPLFDSLALSGLYETMGLGNHDFDFGPEITARFIEGFSPEIPFLAANIDVSAEPALQALADQGRIAGSTVVADSESGMEVAIIGALTPRLPNISSPRGVVVNSDIAGVVNAEVERLEAQGVNRIVLVSHLQGLGEDRELIPQLSGVDIVVAGGGDELLKNSGDTCLADEDAVDSYPLVLTDSDGKEVPVVTAPGGYRCIGMLNVTFDADGLLTGWAGSSMGVPLDGPQEAYALENVEQPLAEAIAELNETIIGSSDVALDGRKPSVRTGPTNVGELLADGLLAAGAEDGAQIAIQNGGGIRNDSEISAGDISAADTFDIAPFANFAVTVEVPRERLKEVLEVGMSGLPDAEGVYPQIAGFTMEVDSSQPGREIDSDGDCGLIGDSGSRVRNVTLDDGTEIVRDGAVVSGEPVMLATIDFLAKGGDCYPLDDLEFVSAGVSYQQALQNWIADGLGGSISGDDYPTTGSRTSIDGSAGSDDNGSDTDSDAGADSSGSDNGGSDDGGSTTEDTYTAPQSESLPNTGIESWMYLIGALSVALGGYIVFNESRRTSRLSLANRLSATLAWIPKDDR